MSGRLIILPKKSWHVGKRENIEKVLRDERLAEEEAAAKRERAREIAQERVVETLTKKRLTTERGESSPQQSEQESAAAGRKRRRKGGDANKKNDHEGYGGTGQGWGVDGALHHVNLFDDAEREAGKRLGQNAEHQKERRDQELLEQKRSGLAPTALGEGSAELKGAHEQPWYSLVSPAAGSARPEVAAGVRAVKLGREVIGEEAEEVLKRDEGRKYRADPMGSFFRHAVDTGAHDGGTTNSSTTTFGAGGRAKASSSSGGSKKLAVADDVDGKAAGSGGEKRVKKHKKEKKHKKKSKSGRKEKHRRRDDRTRSDSPEGSDVAGDEEVAARQRAVEEMRRKRLAREGGERRREIHLLAEREMAGRSLPDERGMAYNNQYHSHVARQNRPR